MVTRKCATECLHTNPKRKRGNIIERPRLRFGLVWEREKSGLSGDKALGMP